MSVYDDIQALIDDEESEITEQRAAAAKRRDDDIAQVEQDHADAYAHADQMLEHAEAEIEAAYDDAQAPLDARWQGLEGLREQVKSLAAQNEAPVPDPTVPTDSESPDPGTPISSEPSTPTVPTESVPSTQADPASLPSSLSTDPDASIPPAADTAPEPLPISSSADLRGVDESQPVAVPLSTGEIKVVTAADVLAAKDPDLNDDDLTPDQVVIRNSDLP